MITVDVLHTCEIFSELTDHELEGLIPFCREERYAKSTVLFNEGDEANTFYILQEGQVSLQYEICPQPDYCQDATILLDKPGEVMGWSSLVKARRLTAFGYCVTDVRVIAIDSKALNELMEQESHIGFVIMKELAGMINKRLKEAKGLTLHRIMGAL